MSSPKKIRRWRILSISAAICLAAGIAFVFQSHRTGEKTTSQTTVRQSVSGPQISVSQRAAETTPSQTGAAPETRLATTTAAAAEKRAASRPSIAPLRQSSAAASVPNASARIASLSDRQRDTLEKIPSARFRDDVLRLAPEAQVRVLKALSAKPVPDADYADLHVTSKGMIYYVCQFSAFGNDDPVAPAETPSAPDAEPAAAPVPISQPPIRHSRPGASRVLFLDFSGLDNITNTAWNKIEAYGKVATYVPHPYDTDDNPSTFSDAEQRQIIQIWERVAEDFAPFDVDVTTERPAAFTRTTARALITRSTDKNSKPMPSGASAGGVAFLNVFGEVDYATDSSPAFIYYNKLGSSAAKIAYAISHELGHNLGLSHDGPGAGTTDEDNGYYEGHGTGATSWAPIMGAGYDKNIVQWSKGEYHNANNHEDDLAIIEGKLGYRGILASNTREDALPLVPDETGHLGATGIIRHDGYAHYYSLNLSVSGSVTLVLDPARLSETGTLGTIVGNTDLKLEILDASGSVIDSNSPDFVTSAGLTKSLASGTSYVRVTSGGMGNPLSASPSGYTGYGAIGQYTLDLVRPDPSLAEALNSNLNWTTDLGSAGWSGQGVTTYDGIAAAQSGAIAQGESSSLVTTVEGPGLLSFRWKLSAAAADALTFVGTGSTASIYGTQNWQQKNIPIGATGTHSFTWTFDKSSANPNAAAWIGNVVWTPTNFVFATTPASKEVASGTGQFTITVTTSKTWTATTDAPSSSWLTVTPASGPGNATLTVTHAANNTGLPRHGAVTITSGGINRICKVAQPAHIDFATALDNSLVWTTGGDADWTTQNIITYDGHHAARSGIIFGTPVPNGTTGQETWLQTTVNGPGTISFWWKVSSEEEENDDTDSPWGDILSFQANGSELSRISGEKNWRQRTITITGTGPQTLKWSYKKDPYFAAGADAAWLDKVAWTTGTGTPTLNISPESRRVPQPDGQFTAFVNSNVSWTAASSAPWLTVSPATGSGAGSLTLSYAANSTATERTATITVSGGGLSDTCTVTQGAFNVTPSSKQVTASKGEFNLLVAASTAWNASTSASWLTISPSSHTRSASATVTHGANTTGASRTATITITSGNLTRTATVTQSSSTTSGTTSGTNNNNNNNNSGGSSSGGGGAPSLWSLAAIGVLLALRRAFARKA